LFEGTGIEVPEFLELDYEYEKQKNSILDESILYFRKATIDDLNRPAFVNRNWNPAVIDFYDLRFDETNDNLVFPVRSPELVGAVGRSAEGKRVHNYFGFFTGKSLGGYDKLTDAKKIAVVEGWTCLANCYQWAAELGFDVVCTFTANVSDVQCQMLADTGKVLHLWLDQDKAGKAGVKRVSEKIDDILFVAEWDKSLGDVGGMSREVFFSTFG